MKFLGAALYCTLLDGLIIGGTAYIVFRLHYSGWWWLLAIVLSGATGVPEGVRGVGSSQQRSPESGK